MKEFTKEIIGSWSKNNTPSSYSLSYTKAPTTDSQAKSSLRNNWALKSKQLSKIIAYSWLDERPQAKEIREVFWHPSKDDGLRELLTSDINSSKWPFLKELFPGGDKYLPIFDEEEIKLYAFKVTWNSFTSSLEDITDNLGTQENTPVFEVILPYPPRPPLDGSFGLTKEDVEDWVKLPLVKETEGHEDILPVFSDTPYIPTTCC